MQATPVQAAQELRPKKFGLARLDLGGVNPKAGPVALDLAVQALGALFVVASAAPPLDFNRHGVLGHELHHLAQQINVGALLGELGQCDR